MKKVLGSMKANLGAPRTPEMQNFFLNEALS
jgi:hypothetical protein